jgi:hypothetical protein
VSVDEGSWSNATTATKQNDDAKDVETCRIFVINNKYENEEQFTPKLWLERRFNNNTGEQ